MQVPQPADTKSEILENNIAKDNERVQQFIKESDESIVGTLDEINRLNSLPPFEQMTYEDIYFHFKQLKPDYEVNPEWTGPNRLDKAPK